MARKPDLPCADCDKLMWRGSTSLPDGQARCRACRGERKPQVPCVQSFICIGCEAEFTRPAIRGTRPKWCPSCRTRSWEVSRPRSVRCVACGSPSRVDAYFCSKSCGANFRERTSWPTCAVPLSHASRRQWPKQGPATRVFIPDCSECSKTFVSIYTTSTCSVECAAEKRRDKRRVGKDRRRARERDAFVAPVYRKRIYERDKWRCHLCGKRVSKTTVAPHPRAATLDHLIPLASGGTHEPANVATAHFICNSLKGDRGGGEQLALVG